MDIYPLAFELGDRYACFKDTFFQTDMSEEERMEYISDAVKLCPAKAILVKNSVMLPLLPIASAECRPGDSDCRQKPGSDS